jgi:hypothetical protein
MLDGVGDEALLMLDLHGVEGTTVGVDTDEEVVLGLKLGQRLFVIHRYLLWKLDAGYWKLDAGSWKLDASNWMLGARVLTLLHDSGFSDSRFSDS